MLEDDKLRESKQYLMSYLKDYGAGKEAKVIWERLDFIRLNLGQLEESRGKYEAALKEYAAVREEGPYYNDAQSAIRRIWLAYQQKHFERQTKAQLLKKAEENFFAKRYLTPVNRNAYSAYQAVLALDPENALAHQRIGQIKDFYGEQGANHFQEENWSKALSYFERYMIIDPDDPDIKAKVSICREKLATAETVVGASESQVQDPEKQIERIKRLLEESGAESTWIMKYLFEEDGGEKESEAPW
jgi:tetratricopeptide (TPR) repeat protein